jgi:hypothetical protein
VTTPAAANRAGRARADETPWQWDTASRRYRNRDTGRYLSAASSKALRDDLVGRLARDTETLARRLTGGDLSLPAWEKLMQRQVKDAHTVQWAFGRGGRNVMTERDREDLAALVRGQWQYLRGFSEAIAGGTLSEAQIVARANLYPAASVQAYERGRASAWDVILPAHPSDGSTQCMTNCRCAWSLRERESDHAVLATWRLGSAEHCADCTRRARQWAPLVLHRAERSQTARVTRLVA